MASERDELVAQHREILERTFAEKHAKLLMTTDEFKKALLHARSHGFNTHAELWNVGIYINLVSHDLSVLVVQLSFERDMWTRKLAARHGALLIYEIAEDMRQLLGKRIREPLTKLGLISNVDHRLRAARKPLDQFWDKHSGELNEVRRISAAHRDLDGLILLQTIEGVDIHYITDLGMELAKILNNIGSVIETILTESSKVQPPELAEGQS